MPDNNIKRINIRMGQQVHDWYEAKADELGVPTSALMIVALNEYRKMQTSADSMPLLTDMYRMMQQQPIEENLIPLLPKKTV